MKHLYILLGFLILFTGCKNNNNETLVFNTETATRFISLMDYLQNKSPKGFDNKQYTPKEKVEGYQNNLKDSILNDKIDSLLTLPTYSELAEITRAFKDTSTIQGKEAYRFAFMNLPYKTIPMSGGISESWINFWKEGGNKKAINFINTIKDHSFSVTENTIQLAEQFLPSDINNRSEVETVFCIDGNRGSFTVGEKIYMDLLDFKNFDLDRFTKILAHEFHHVIYETWLDQYNVIETLTEKEKVIFDFQKGIIMEGLAQQINYNDYNDQTKELYNKRLLLKELQNTWTNNFKAISVSKDPLNTYDTRSDKMWNQSSDLLKKYCKEKIEEETYPHRPTTVYYLGFHLYHSILKNGGKKQLDLVINHPDMLLETYNNTWKEGEVLQKFPEDIVKLWKANFKTKN